MGRSKSLSETADKEHSHWTEFNSVLTGTLLVFIKATDLSDRLVKLDGKKI